MAAIELIAEQPIHYIDDRIAVCDGGGGPRGHPKIFINVDKPGSHACGYCTFCLWCC
jgi:NADH dehydrogenase (ubiquinone) Fe-S protein 6